MDDLALSKAEDMRSDPQIGDGRIPGAWDSAERGQEKIVDRAKKHECEGDESWDEEEVVRRPRDRE